jgi:hypothetical protein
MDIKGGRLMTTWKSDELNKIGSADELQIASLRRDGTLRSPVTIWVVRLGDDLYVRAGGVDKDVTFVEETESAINDQIDAAYRTKYRRYPARYVDPIVVPQARAATIKLVPRSTNPGS